MADTQGEGASMFRQSAMNRISSADDLDKYIRVTNPSAWIVLLASLLFIGGLAVWAATAIIPTTISVAGLLEGDTVVCWVDASAAEKIERGGASASVAGEKTTDLSIDTIPDSKAEVKQRINSDYLAESIALKDWNYAVTFKTPPNVDGKSQVIPVSITFSETHPLNLVLGNQ